VKNQKIFWKGSSILWTFFLIYLLIKPGGSGTPWWHFFPHIDKLIHFTIFAIWSNLTAQSRSLSKTWIILTIFTGITIGAATEWIQSFIPNRHGNILDFAADLAGTLAGVFFTLYLCKKKQYSRN